MNSLGPSSRYSLVTDKDLARRALASIVSFYLFDCPLEGRSAQAKTFSQLGWRGSYFSSLKASILSASVNLDVKHYLACRGKDVESTLISRGLGEGAQEFAVFSKYDVARVMESLFSAIRNSIAHGSFKVYTPSRKAGHYYYLENRHDGTVKACINLSEKTLLSWRSGGCGHFSVPPYRSVTHGLTKRPEGRSANEADNDARGQKKAVCGIPDLRDLEATVHTARATHSPLKWSSQGFFEPSTSGNGNPLQVSEPKISEFHNLRISRHRKSITTPSPISTRGYH